MKNLNLNIGDVLMVTFSKTPVMVTEIYNGSIYVADMDDNFTQITDDKEVKEVVLTRNQILGIL